MPIPTITGTRHQKSFRSEYEPRTASTAIPVKERQPKTTAKKAPVSELPAAKIRDNEVIMRPVWDSVRLRAVWKKQTVIALSVVK